MGSTPLFSPMLCGCQVLLQDIFRFLRFLPSTHNKRCDNTFCCTHINNMATGSSPTIKVVLLDIEGRGTLHSVAHFTSTCAHALARIEPYTYMQLPLRTYCTPTRTFVHAHMLFSLFLFSPLRHHNSYFFCFGRALPLRAQGNPSTLGNKLELPGTTRRH